MRDRNAGHGSYLDTLASPPGWQAGAAAGSALAFLQATAILLDEMRRELQPETREALKRAADRIAALAKPRPGEGRQP